jgi:mRNA-degrading endonuclease RelE of RelBE toxin-antitoxin system
MRTVIETLAFQQQASKIWTPEQREEFIVWIALNPSAGDVIPGASGARKVRRAASGRGKSGGARVIYFHLSEEGVVLLIAVYVKVERSTMTAKEIRKVDHGH